MNTLDGIRANARLTLKQLGPISHLQQFGFNRQSVEWVAGYIERQRVRPDIKPETINGLTSVLGSFLGECIISCYGGTWSEIDGMWGIAFDDGNAAFPFNKIEKHLANGAEAGDSILGFFDSIGPLFKRKLHRRPWWKFW